MSLVASVEQDTSVLHVVWKARGAAKQESGVGSALVWS